MWRDASVAPTVIQAEDRRASAHPASVEVGIRNVSNAQRKKTAVGGGGGGGRLLFYLASIVWEETQTITEAADRMGQERT
jgi:hypothetical protein